MPTAVRRADEGVDGRLSRAVRSRQALCDACLDLVEEGVLQPSADQIAERAGLSRRSVFYHFGDLAELYDAVVEVGMQRCAPLLKEIPADAPLDERIASLAEVRSRFFEATAPFTRALTAQVLVGTARDQAWRVSLEALALQKEDVARVFAAELDRLPPDERTEVLDALSVATCPSSWEYLRRSQGLSMPRARAVLQRSLRAILGDAGA